MNKQPNANLFAAVLVVTAVVAAAILPISIEIKTHDAVAQETPVPDIEYTLDTVIGGTPAMAFVGVGGEIDGIINPVLTAQTGQTIRINLLNSSGVLHDLVIPDFNVSTGEVVTANDEASVTFTVTQPGDYRYICSVPGHEQIGMAGVLRVVGEPVVVEGDYVNPAQAVTAAAVGPAAENAVSIVRSPSDVPPPVGNRAPMTLRIDLTAVEVTGFLADGTTFDYFTFDGTIPGPMIRIRVGDTVQLYLRNEDGSRFPHSIDLHAVTGPGGGAVYTQTNPDGETYFTFQALNPGLYVYHCATPSVAHHIANGMYGLILVEPEGGLPPVSHEFYVMQGEVYTAQPFGTPGHLTFDHAAMLDEQPEYFIFNGAANALTLDEFALRANVGDTVRIYFGVGGPNFTSSFHVIGEIFDRVYNLASLTSEPLRDVQTVLVPPGGAVMVEFTVEVPGRYILVDHALSRLERGLAGFLYVEGEDNHAVFFGEEETAGSGH